MHFAFVPEFTSRSSRANAGQMGCYTPSGAHSSKYSMIFSWDGSGEIGIENHVLERQLNPNYYVSRPEHDNRTNQARWSSPACVEGECSGEMRQNSVGDALHEIQLVPPRHKQQIPVFKRIIISRGSRGAITNLSTSFQA